MNLKLWLLVVVVLAAGALYIYPPGKIELHRRRADAEASLTAIESLRSELPKIPPAINFRDTLLRPGTSGKLSPENTAFVHAEDLGNLAADAPMAFRFCDNDNSDLKRTAFLVRNGRWPDGSRLSPLLDTPGHMDSFVDRLVALRYVFVIRQDSDFYVAPKVMRGIEFKPGRYSGLALLFELRPRKFLGGIFISGSNSYSISSSETAEDAVVTDLANDVRKDLDIEVSKRFPPFGRPSGSLNLTCTQ